MPNQPIDPRVLELLLRGRGTENVADADAPPGSMFEALTAAGNLQYGTGAPQQAGLNYLGGAPTPDLQEDTVALRNRYTNRGVTFPETGQFRSAGMLARHAFGGARPRRQGYAEGGPAGQGEPGRPRPSTPAGMARRIARRPR